MMEPIKITHSLTVWHRTIEGPDGIFVEEGFQGRHGFTRYGPISNAATAKELIAERQRELDAIVEKAGRAMQDHYVPHLISPSN